MKFVMFSVGQGVERLGAIINEDQLLDLTKAGATPEFASLIALIEAGDVALEQARSFVASPPSDALVDRSAARLLAPLSPPPQMRDFIAFEEHLTRSARNLFEKAAEGHDDPEEIKGMMFKNFEDSVMPAWRAQPVYYKCNRFAVTGHEEEVVWPEYSLLMDYELELAAVIGKKGRDIAASDAGAHIFGFTVFNDLSARDAQAKETPCYLGPAKGKDFDKANVLGPCVVTADEIGDPQDLTMISRINGEEQGRGSSSTMHWTFNQMIEHISRGETIYPGEVIGSGTVGGGCGLETGRFLANGDVIELEIEKIGVLRNRIVAQHT